MGDKSTLAFASVLASPVVRAKSPLPFLLLLKVAYADYTHYHFIGRKASSEASAFVNHQGVCVRKFLFSLLSSGIIVGGLRSREDPLKRIFWEGSPSLVFLA